MLQLSLYNENHEFVKLNELKTRFLTDRYYERPGMTHSGQIYAYAQDLSMLYICNSCIQHSNTF